MPILTNTTDQPIRASTGHTVPPKGTLGVSADTLERIGNEPYIRRELRAGRLTVAPDAPVPAPDLATREGLAVASRDDLLAVLDAHGLGADLMGEQTDDELRRLAGEVTFL